MKEVHNSNNFCKWKHKSESEKILFMTAQITTDSYIHFGVVVCVTARLASRLSHQFPRGTAFDISKFQHATRVIDA